MSKVRFDPVSSRVSSSSWLARSRPGLHGSVERARCGRGEGEDGEQLVVFNSVFFFRRPIRGRQRCDGSARLPPSTSKDGILYSQEGSDTGLRKVGSRARGPAPVLLTRECSALTSPTLQPQPSLASLPQLAADLIIHTLKLDLVGFLGLQDFVPAVSGLDSSDTASPAPEGVSFAVEGSHSARWAGQGTRLKVVNLGQCSRTVPRRSRSSSRARPSSAPASPTTPRAFRPLPPLLGSPKSSLSPRSTPPRAETTACESACPRPSVSALAPRDR